MTQNNFSDLPKLQSNIYENIFNVYTDENEKYFYNLLQTISLPQNLPDGYYEQYNIMPGDTWPFISYKVYKNPNVWWVILIANNIKNPINTLIPGTTIKIPKIEVVKIIVSQLSKQQ